MPRKKKDSTPITSPVTPHGGKPVPNQSLQETENTYAIICATIIKAVSSSKHYLYFLPDKRNIDNAIKLGALYMRDDYSNTSDLEKLGIFPRGSYCLKISTGTIFSTYYSTIRQFTPGRSWHIPKLTRINVITF